MKDEKKRTNPTPYLKPRSRDKVFTAQENKMLDQITIEICEAWEKDLKVIKECHQEAKESLKIFNSLNDTLQQKYENLCILMENDEISSSFRTVLENQIVLFSFMEDTRQSLFKLEQKLGYDSMKSLNETASRLENHLKNLTEKPAKCWWEFWK